MTLRVFYTRNVSTGFRKPKLLRSSAVQLQSRWNSSLMPSPLNWLEWTPLWCATTSNFAPTDSSSALAATALKFRNPFEWMETISLQGKTNFFEKHVGEYSKSGVGVDRADQSFALDTSFWHPFSILHLSPAPYMLHVTYFCSSWNTHIPTLVASWGFTEKQLHKVWRMSLKSNEYFGRRDLHPLQPNAISPSGSVMII